MVLPLATAAVSKWGAAARDAIGGMPLPLLEWFAVFVFLYFMLCPTRTPRQRGVGFALGALGMWLLDLARWAYKQASKHLDRAVGLPAELLEKALNALKPYLPRFLRPLLDWVLSMLRRFKDALMSPVVKSAVLAILGVWLILRLFRR